MLLRKHSCNQILAATTDIKPISWANRIRWQGCSEDPTKLETRWPASKNNSSCPARTLHPCRNNSVLAVGWPFLGRAEIVVWSDSVIPGVWGQRVPGPGQCALPVFSLTPHTWSTAHAGSTGSKNAPSGTWAQEHVGRTVILNLWWCLTIQLIAVGRSIPPPKAAVERALLKFLFEWVLFKAVQIQLWGECSALCSPFMGSVQRTHTKSCPISACTNRTNHSSFNHYFFFLDYAQICTKDVLQFSLSQWGRYVLVLPDHSRWDKTAPSDTCPISRNVPEVAATQEKLTCE